VKKRISVWAPVFPAGMANSARRRKGRRPARAPPLVALSYGAGGAEGPGAEKGGSTSHQAPNRTLSAKLARLYLQARQDRAAKASGRDRPGEKFCL